MTKSAKTTKEWVKIPRVFMPAVIVLSRKVALALLCLIFALPQTPTANAGAWEIFNDALRAGE